jgi:hypothetical protein
MIVNRRTYRILPGHWEQALTLGLHIRDLTRTNLQRDYEVLIPRFGPHRTICFEWHLMDEADQNRFFHDQFYPLLESFGGLTEWFSHVDQADSFLYRTQNIKVPVNEEVNQACRHGMIIYRQFYLPVTMNRPDYWSMMIAMQEETRSQFQREIRLLNSFHAGIMSQMWVEFSYTDLEDQQRFEKDWQAHMVSCGLIGKFDAEVGQGQSELWYSMP